MPKNSGLKLFTKTWPLSKDRKGKEEEQKRPLTATLEKPTILDIRFIGKIDMSMVRKEFLNISNLCRLPLVLKQKEKSSRPLSLLSADTYRKSKKKRKKPDPCDDSHEDDESSVVQSAKVNNRQTTTKSRSKSLGRVSSNKYVINQLKQNNILCVKNIVNDANNNKTVKVPSRKPTLTTIAIPITPLSCPDLMKSSTKLPSPCRACGRPDLPERFHSHPTTPLKPSPRNSSKGIKSLALEVEKVPVKSTVQKPVAIKYNSKNASATSDTRKASPVKKSLNSANLLPSAIVKKASPNLSKSGKSPVKQSSPKTEKESTMGRKSITPLRDGSGKRTLTCYICGREFGTASLPLHEPKCMEKWERENASLPVHLRRKPPVKPEGEISQKEWNQLAWESSQSTLVPCNNCSRTFYPDRLEVHQRSCKVQLNNNNNNNTSNESHFSNLSTPMSQHSNTSSTSTSSKAHQPPSVECYICGRMFGTHSIKIHEKQCLKKWHVENESLPHDMRSPAPLKTAKKQLQSEITETTIESNRSSATPSPKSSKDERPASGTKSPLFPCYLCGKLFTVNSIYIHEPQCLKMWKIENDKLPPNKRRPVPLKPDIKFTRSGKLNFEDTGEAYWQSHLSQLVPCKTCSRTFNPDRVAVHERSCKGN